jgi:hypothetical protein
VTNTDRAVKRRTCTDTIFEKGKHRRIIIEVGGGRDPDLVRFRLEGMRDRTDGLSIKELFWTDFKRTATRRWEKKNEERKANGKRRLKKLKFDRHA